MDGEKFNYIALSIPVFFILIGIELAYSAWKGLRLYRLNDTITNISLGIGQQVTGVFMKGALFAGYLWLYDNARVFEIPTTWLTWTALFLGVDFFYYWFHRMSHEVNALWAAHIVHHQSEEYNLSVALRQSWFQSAFSWVFYLPLAVAGFNPIMFITISSFNTLYQFWIHTRTIGKMGPLEWLINTPSHHRVHHASDPKYIDKNHAGTLIIWDRMFGTFIEEDQEPVYGITTQLNSWNPIWANLHYWRDLFDLSARSKNWLDKLRVFIAPPGWHPAELGGFQPPKEIDKATYRPFDLDLSKAIHVYVCVTFALALGVSVLLLFNDAKWPMVAKLLCGVYSIWTIANLGGLFEGRKWVVASEFARCIALPVGLMLVPAFGVSTTTVQVVAVFSALQCAWFARASRKINPQ